MKRFLLICFIATFVFTLVGCTSKSGEPTGDIAPAITLGGWDYYAPYMPVNELPEDYVYAGTLTKEEANDTGLEGCKYYFNYYYDSIPDIYVYQKCGTPIDENTVDSENLQWAYVQWIHPYEK